MPSDQRNELAVNMACSAAGPALSCVFTNPADVAKTRLNMERELQPPSATRVYRGVVDCVARLWREEGLSGLQRGLRFAMVREGSKNCFRLGLFDPILRAAHGDHNAAAAPMWLRGLVGASTGAIAAMICNPLDLLKTRLQLEAAHPRSVSASVASVTLTVRQVCCPRAHHILFHVLLECSSMASLLPMCSSFRVTVSYHFGVAASRTWHGRALQPQ